jgi:hypothetical protein
MSDLQGMGSRFGPFGAPEYLTGRAKLEDDITRICLRVLYERALLRVTLSEADLGNISKMLEDAVQDSENWWPGQEAPVSLVEVKISVRNVKVTHGVTVDASEDGNLEINVGYFEQSTGVIVQVDAGDALVIPFGSFGGANA